MTQREQAAMSEPARREYTVDHRLSDAERNVHRAWDNSLDPALTVESGAVVRFECRDAVDRQLDTESTAAEFADVSFDPVHPLTGPVAVEGAEPGDVIEVELLDLQHKGWGYTGFLPGEMGLGLLPEDFPEADVHIWDLEGDVGHFVNGIEIPLDPFPGVIGLAPGDDGEHDTLPPYDTGGNMDVKHMTAGSTVYLPQGENPAVYGGRESDMGLTNRRRSPAETPTFTTGRDAGISKGYVGSRHLRGSTRRAETSVRGILGRRFPRVGSATDRGVRVVRQHGNPAYGSGKCDRTDRAVRHDRLGERRPEKTGVNDSLADGSARDSATGRSRARDETPSHRPRERRS